MGMMSGVTFSFVHMTIFLTAAFFVMTFARKADVAWLRGCGYAVVACLLVSSVLVFTGGPGDVGRYGRHGMMRKAPCPFSEKGFRGGMKADPAMMKKGAPDPFLDEAAPDEPPPPPEDGSADSDGK